MEMDNGTFRKKARQVMEAFGDTTAIGKIALRRIEEVPTDLSEMISGDPLGVFLCGYQCGFFVAGDVVRWGEVSPKTDDVKDACFEALGFKNADDDAMRLISTADDVVRDVLGESDCGTVAVSHSDDPTYLFMLGEFLGYNARKHEFDTGGEG